MHCKVFHLSKEQRSERADSLKFLSSKTIMSLSSSKMQFKNRRNSQSFFNYTDIAIDFQYPSPFDDTRMLGLCKFVKWHLVAFITLRSLLLGGNEIPLIASLKVTQACRASIDSSSSSIEHNIMAHIERAPNHYCGGKMAALPKSFMIAFHFSFSLSLQCQQCEM